MIGHLLTLLTVAASFGLGVVALQQVLARRIRIAVRMDDRISPENSASDLR